MNRKFTTLLLTLALGLLAAPPTEAQQAGKVPRIGALSANAASAVRPGRTAFLESLREHGYIDGQNIAIEWRFADGNIERLPSLAAELVRLNVDVIFVTTGPGARAVKNATGTIPIVFMAVADPVALGLVESLARPGGNVTGVSNVQEELTPKRLEILNELVPGARKVGVLKPPVTPEVTAHMKKIDSAAKSLGLELHVEEVKGPERFEHAFAAMKTEQVGAVMVIPAPLFFTHRERVAEVSKKARLPLMGFVRELTDAGALLSYGQSNADMARRAAAHVARILKGTKPADLPVEQPTKFELVINMKTAKALGLTIPPSVLLRADQVIE